MDLDGYVLTKKVAKEFAPALLTENLAYTGALGYQLVIPHRDPSKGTGVIDVYTDDTFAGILTGSAPFPPSEYSAFGAANVNNVRSSIPLGFRFPIGFREYDYAFISVNGWIELTDELTTTMPFSDLYSTNYTATYDGPRIFPWYDDLTTARFTDVGGVFIKTFNDPEDGLKTFCVRWVTWASYLSDTAILNFECWLKPTGEIQFRYAAKRNFTGASSAAAIGVIVSPQKYRDFLTDIELYGGSRTTVRYDGLLETDWPGSNNSGAVWKFKPKYPTNTNQPRIRIRKKDAERSLPDSGQFDDRITILKSQQKVAFPTLIPTQYGKTTIYADEWVDVATTVTASLIPRTYSSDGWINRKYPLAKPFNEHEWLGGTGDIDTVSSGTRYQTASDNPSPVSSPTSAERSITFTLPVITSSLMGATTADLMYYNSKTKVFENKYGLGGVYYAPSFDDFKLFGPFGSFQLSGSVYRPLIGDILTQPNKEFGKSTSYLLSNVPSGSNLLNIVEYAHDSDGCIEYTGTEPIIVDKVSFAIPMKAGPGWFADRTRFVNAANYLSVGGPAVTFALLRQRDAVSRDIIASGTMIPTQDNILTSSIYPGPQDLITYHPIGYRQFGYPAVVVPSSSNGYFTGTIQTTVKTSKTTGFVLAGPAEQYSRNATAYSTIPYGHRYDGQPTPRSVFAGVPSFTTQSLDSVFDYVGVHQYDTAAVAAAAYGVNEFDVFYTQFQNFSKTIDTPYIIYPGDKLIVALAKHRPWFGYDNTWEVPQYRRVTGSHDISTNTGELKIQLHGYTLSGGNQKEFFRVTEYDDTAAIRAEDAGPPADIFLLDRTDAYVGSSFDMQYSGSLVRKQQSIANAITLVTGVRDFAGSKINSWQHQFDLTKVNSDRYIPRSETCGFERFFTSFAEDECIYDSLPPNPIDILKISGQYSTDATEHRLGNVGQLRGPTTGSAAEKFYQYVSIYGYDGIRRWDRAFPFEPYYARAQRINGSIGFEKLIDADVSASLKTPAIFVASIPEHATSLATLGWAENAYIEIDGVQPLTSVYKSRPKVYAGLMLLAEPTEYTPLNGFRSSSISMPQEKVYMSHMFGTGDTAPTIVDDQYWYSGSMSYKNSGGSTVGGKFCITKRILQAPNFRRVIPYMYDVTAGACGWKTIDNEGIANVNPLSFSFSSNDGVPTVIGYGAILRGYRYGLAGIEPRQSAAVFSPRSFGMMRDMLEQRQDTKYVSRRGRTLIKSGPVTVRFVSIKSRAEVDPLLTDSSNLSTEATSSLPFFDNTNRNRPEATKKTLRNANVKITVPGKNTKNLTL